MYPSSLFDELVISLKNSDQLLFMLRADNFVLAARIEGEHIYTLKFTPLPEGNWRTQAVHKERININ